MFLPLDKDYPVMLASQVKLPPTQQPNQKTPVPTTPTIPPIQKLLITCCKSNLSAEETRFLTSELSSLDHEPNNNNTWQDFLNLVSVHGVLPLAYQTIYKYAKDAIAPENFSILKQSYMATVGRNMLMSAELIKVMALLEENGIEALTLQKSIQRKTKKTSDV